jgi:hypothetical protein
MPRIIIVVAVHTSNEDSSSSAGWPPSLDAASTDRGMPARMLSMLFSMTSAEKARSFARSRSSVSILVNIFCLDIFTSYSSVNILYVHIISHRFIK